MTSDPLAMTTETPISVEVSCRSCGTLIHSGQRFCSNCGVPLRDADSPAHRDPLLGAKIAGKYEVMARLGAGGMGVVYQVRHTALDRVAAMKLMHGDLARDSSMVKRFHREARAVSRLSSRYTVSVFDYGQSAGLLYLVMELLTGQDLEQIILAGGPIEPARVARLVRHVSASLAEAHELGIIHRDIKPQNLFVATEEGQEICKVLDFGLAKLTGSHHENATETEVVIGTPRYMSPEQISGGAVDSRADTYALACVVWEMLTGHPPFGGENLVQILHGHTSGVIPDLAMRRPDLAAIGPVLTRAMAKSPGDRYPTVAAFSAALDEAVSGVSQAGLSQQAPAVQPRSANGDARAKRATRDEFERWEQRMRMRQAGKAGAALVAAGGLVAGAIWFISMNGDVRYAHEQEPNGQIAQATPVALGSVVTGTMGEFSSNADERDLYRVDMPEGAERFTASVTGVGGVDLGLDVVYGDGTRAIVINSRGPGEGETLGGFVPRDPTFFLLVYSVDGTTNPVVEYEFSAHTRPAYDGEEREPNDQRPSAEVLREGQAFTGFLGWRGDVDAFIIPSLESPAMLTISAVDGVDFKLETVDGEGEATLLEPELTRTGQLSLDIDPSGRPRFYRLQASNDGYNANFAYVVNLVEIPAPDEEPDEGSALVIPDPAEATHLPARTRRNRQTARSRDSD